MSKKTVRNMMVILMLLTVGLYFISGTYARYTSTASGEGTAQVAKWAVKLNEKDMTITENTFPITFTQVENANVVNNYIAPASKLYADFIIDPAGSQVAMDYEFTLGEITAESGTVPTTLKVEKVVTVTTSGQTETETEIVKTGEKYIGTIDLASKDAALTNAEAVKVRVYIVWEDLNTPEANETDTAVGISAPQLTMEVTATATQDVD